MVYSEAEMKASLNQSAWLGVRASMNPPARAQKELSRLSSRSQAESLLGLGQQMAVSLNDNNYYRSYIYRKQL